MRSLCFGVGLLCAVTFSTAADPAYPTHTLNSDALRVTVYLPDARAGFYRGTRFDHAGVCTVQYGKHAVFGPWKGKHDPTNNDDIVGPVQEFGSGFSSPLHYADAKVGEAFLKIGVGELEKPKEEKYRFYHNYKFIKPGDWSVEKSDKKISFEQKMNTGSGYGYKYTKTIVVDEARMSFFHVLENTGSKRMETDVYNHNFFNVDDDAVGENYAVEFAFTPKPRPTKEPAILGKFAGKVFTTENPEAGSLYYELDGFDPAKASDNMVTLKHFPSGLQVKAAGNQPLSRINLWGTRTVLCPEPFLQLDIAPGKKATWTWTYTFAK